MAKVSAENLTWLNQAIKTGMVTNDMVTDLRVTANPYLMLVAGTVVRQTNGAETIAMSFPGLADTRFDECRMRKSSQPTKAVRVRVYEMDPGKCWGASLNDMFKSLDALDQLVLTQGQIAVFCKDNPSLLLDHQTFFLFKVDGDDAYYVARVTTVIGNFLAHRHQLGDPRCPYDREILFAKDRHRLVVPHQQ